MDESICYVDPMQRLNASFQRPAISNTYTATYTPAVVQQPLRDTNSSKCTPCRVCFIVCCVLFIIQSIISIIVGLTKS
jgi:hypothetical protein